MIVWSKRASDQLDAIFEYIALDSPVYTLRFVETLISNVELLSTQPLSGRIVPEENDPNVREFQVHPYRVIYSTLDNQIEILTIIHSARLLRDLHQ